MLRNEVCCLALHGNSNLDSPAQRLLHHLLRSGHMVLPPVVEPHLRNGIFTRKQLLILRCPRQRQELRIRSSINQSPFPGRRRKLITERCSGPFKRSERVVRLQGLLPAADDSGRSQPGCSQLLAQLADRFRANDEVERANPGQTILQPGMGSNISAVLFTCTGQQNNLIQ